MYTYIDIKWIFAPKNEEITNSHMTMLKCDNAGAPLYRLTVYVTCMYVYTVPFSRVMRSYYVTLQALRGSV